MDIVHEVHQWSEYVVSAEPGGLESMQSVSVDATGLFLIITSSFAAE